MMYPESASPDPFRSRWKTGFLSSAGFLILASCSSAPRPRVQTPSHGVESAQECEAPASENVPVHKTVEPKDTVEPSTSGCKIAHAQDFDFWIGRWEVRTPDGKLAGYNHIHPILDGCTLQEDYRTANGAYMGRSLNRYDPASRTWHQVWVDNGGLWLSLEGGLKEGAMVMRGSYMQRRDAKGQVLAQPRSTLQEIRWDQLADKRVRQTWRSSVDEGQTWTTLFEGYYTRVKAIPNKQ